MMFEEFQRLAKKEWTFKQYEGMIEPLYMEGEMSKEDFVKMVEKVPTEILEMVGNLAKSRGIIRKAQARAVQERNEARVEAADERAKNVTLTSRVQSLETCLKASQKQVCQTKLFFAFRPGEALMSLRNDFFEEYETAKKEFEEMLAVNPEMQK